MWFSPNIWIMVGKSIVRSVDINLVPHIYFQTDNVQCWKYESVWCLTVCLFPSYQKFAVECDWKSTFSQNIRKRVFLWKKIEIFLNSVKMTKFWRMGSRCYSSLQDFFPNNSSVVCRNQKKMLFLRINWSLLDFFSKTAFIHLKGILSKTKERGTFMFVLDNCRLIYIL